MSQSASSENIGWKWFEYHAKQRLDMFKFYLSIYAGAMGLGVAIFDKGFSRSALFFGVLSFVLSAVFWRLDVRSRRLIEIGERMVSAHCSASGMPDDLNPVLLAAKHTGGLRLKAGFNAVFFMGGLMGLFLAGISYAAAMQLALFALK